MLVQEKFKYQKLVVPFLFLLSFAGIVLQIERGLLQPNSGSSFLLLMLYFTNQSNFLVFIATLLFILKKDSIHVQRFTFITLINITLTGIIFNTLLVPYFSRITFLQVLLHTINPILFIAFYFLVYTNKLKTNNAWIALIYPMIYFVLVYAIIHPLLGSYLISQFPNSTSVAYIYPFLDPATYTLGYVGVFVTCFLIILPILLVFAYLVLVLKQRLDGYLTNKKSV